MASEMLSAILPKWATETTTCKINMPIKLIVAAILIITIFLVYVYWKTLGDIDASIYGFWEIDSSFAEKANLDTMYIYINAPNNDASKHLGFFGQTLSTYIFIKAEGEVRHNGLTSISWARRTLRSDVLQKYNLSFDEAISIIPKNLSAEYDPVTQMLVLRNSASVYARLFKKPEISFYCTSSATLPNEAGDNAEDSEASDKVQKNGEEADNEDNDGEEE